MWKYKIALLKANSEEAFQSGADAYGADGWEMYHVVWEKSLSTSEGTFQAALCFFKKYEAVGVPPRKKK